MRVARVRGESPRNGRAGPRELDISVHVCETDVRRSFPRTEARTPRRGQISRAALTCYNLCGLGHARSISSDGATVRPYLLDHRIRCRQNAGGVSLSGRFEQCSPASGEHREGRIPRRRARHREDRRHQGSEARLRPQLPAAAAPRDGGDAVRRQVGRSSAPRARRGCRRRATTTRAPSPAASKASTFTITAQGRLAPASSSARSARPTSPAKVGETLGSEFDRHNVLLAEPIKELGDYAVDGAADAATSAPTVNVSVVGEDGTTAADIQREGRRRHGREGRGRARRRRTKPRTSATTKTPTRSNRTRKRPDRRRE